MRRLLGCILFLFFLIPNLVAQGVVSDITSTTTEENLITRYLQHAPINMIALQLMPEKNLSSTEVQQYVGNLSNFIEQLQKKRERFSSDQTFISHVFYKTHRKFLKAYTPISSFGSMMKNGEYDCLSGSILYSIILSSLNIDYEVIEVNYHVYVKVKYGGRNLLFESTDPINGLITNASDIATWSGRNGNTIASFSIEDVVNLHNLVGLQYYNIAVRAYKTKDYDSAIDLLEKATIFSDSQRIIYMGKLLAYSFSVNKEIDNSKKLMYLGRVHQLDDNMINAIAQVNPEEF